MWQQTFDQIGEDWPVKKRCIIDRDQKTRLIFRQNYWEWQLIAWVNVQVWLGQARRISSEIWFFPRKSLSIFRLLQYSKSVNNANGLCCCMATILVNFYLKKKHGRWVISQTRGLFLIEAPLEFCRSIYTHLNMPTATNSGVDPKDSIKCLVIGDGAVGKVWISRGLL